MQVEFSNNNKKTISIPKQEETDKMYKNCQIIVCPFIPKREKKTLTHEIPQTIWMLSERQRNGNDKTEVRETKRLCLKCDVWLVGRAKRGKTNQPTITANVETNTQQKSCLSATTTLNSYTIKWEETVYIFIETGNFHMTNINCIVVQ